MSQAILDQTPFPLAHCNRAIRYVYVNKSYAALIGRPPDDIVGKRVIDVIGADAFETIRPHIEAVLGGERAEFETEIKLPHLEPRQYQVVLVPERDELSQVVGYIVSIIDVTERNKAVQEKIRLERLVAQLSMPLASARVGLWDWDLRTGSVSWTPELKAIYGLEAGRVETYSDFSDRLHPDDVQDMEARRDAAIKARETFQLEFRIVRPDGKTRWVMGVGGAVYDNVTGEPVRVMGSSIDVTDMKVNEEQAELQRKELIHLMRVATLGGVSGAIAHELSQPLAAILANAQAAQAEFVIRRIKVDTDFNAGLPPIWGDSVELQQVLINLLMNAVEAMASTPAPDRMLKIVTRETEKGNAEVSVRDRGRGVPEAELKRIFEPFFTTKDGGLGLGLSICSTIVTSHRGQITLRNASGGGMIATVSLPVARLVTAS